MSYFILSCSSLVLFCPVLSSFLLLDIPLAVFGNSETVKLRPVLHRSSYQTEGAGFSPIQSVCLCPLLNLPLTLLTFFSSPSCFFLSLFSSLYLLTAPGSASLLFIHPKHCWGTLAWISKHDSGALSRTNHIPYFLPYMTAPCRSFVMFADHPAISLSVFPTFFSVPPLCVCMDVVSCHK